MKQLPVMKGTLDLLVLKALSWTPMHGFEITAWIESHSGGRLAYEDSALYQALYRMEARGLVTAEWGVTENSRRARYYRVTRSGRAHLAAEIERWTHYARLVSGVLAAQGREA